jgi:hypothetical protein
MKEERLSGQQGTPNHSLTSLRHSIECCDGVAPNGQGIGATTGVNVTDSTATEVTIEVWCNWTMPQTQGHFAKSVTVPLGSEAVAGNLSDGATFKAAWRQSAEQAAAGRSVSGGAMRMRD